MDKDFNRPEALGILNNLRKICNHPYMFFSYIDGPKNSNNCGFKSELIKLNCSTDHTRFERLRKQAELTNKSGDYKEIDS